MSLRQSVITLFPQFTVGLEGCFSNLYSDVKRLVTTGQGILCDPIERAFSLEWWISGRRATEQEVRNDWNAIKSRALAMSDDDLQRWTATAQAPLTSVRLKQDYLDALILKRLRGNFDYIVKNLIPGLADAPADAQLGTMSLAWAIGAGFDRANPPRPEFIAAARAGNWVAAAAAARLREAGNKGVIERNRQQDICFANAAASAKRGLDPAALWWPNKCPTEDSLKTLAVKALDLGIAKASNVPPCDDES